jgi:putative flippase GtrA
VARKLSPIVIQETKKALQFVRENDFATVRSHVLSHDAHPLLQFVKYGVCGVGAFIVHMLVVYLLGFTVFPAVGKDIPIDLKETNTLINNSFGFLVSCAFAYWTNINFVFRPGRHGKRKEVTLFFVISAFSFFAGLFSVPLIFDLVATRFPAAASYVEHFGNLAFAVTSALVNFVCRKFIIFDK